MTEKKETKQSMNDTQLYNIMLEIHKTTSDIKTDVSVMKTTMTLKNQAYDEKIKEIETDVKPIKHFYLKMTGFGAFLLTLISLIAAFIK